MAAVLVDDYGGYSTPSPIKDDKATLPTNMKRTPSSSATPTTSTSSTSMNQEPNYRYQPKVIGNYSLSESLGKGSMGKVKLGVHNVTGDKVKNIYCHQDSPSCELTQFKSGVANNKTPKQIAKEYAREENREMRTIREAHMMMLLRHPNIVGLKDLVVAGPYFYILMDYVNGGQLLHYIVKRQRLSEKRARNFARQIVSALDYMHRNSIVHRDLKIENIMIDKSGRKIKIIDFGLSNMFCPERQLTTYCGSLYFAAPELLRATPYNGPEVDIWSLGVVIYVMVTGSVPFDDKSMPGLHEKIKRGEVSYPAHLGEECVDLLRRIFITDPAQRIYLSDIALHPWMNLELPPIRNYLPIRQPLSLPLDQRIINQMSHGMGLGSAEEISNKLDVIVQSPVYRDAAMLVREHQTKPASLSNDVSQPPFYDDPQSIPAAYHPLVSVYHLTLERQYYLQEVQAKKPISLSRKASVESVTSSGGLSSAPGSQVSLNMVDDQQNQLDSFSSTTTPARKITDVPLNNMVQPTTSVKGLASQPQANFASSDYLSRIQRWLRSSTSQHHLDESPSSSPTTSSNGHGQHHTTASPLTTQVTNADDHDDTPNPSSQQHQQHQHQHLHQRQLGPPTSSFTSSSPAHTTSMTDDTNMQATPLPAKSLLRKLSFVVLRRGASNKSSKNRPLPPLPPPSAPVPVPSVSTTPTTPKVKTRHQRSASSASAAHVTMGSLSSKLGALLGRSTSYNKRPQQRPS
ncbi:kinase-like domain-containing protein [Absidia repens]|uniref:Kinase-like domain-containing protein n=1 Tax=Absidia repens TaxID=90262 RepID=A0A1X2IQN4_9FUNG|nr:kinase-like domain-containing protein [Absidia repens]